MPWNSADGLASLLTWKKPTDGRIRKSLESAYKTPSLGEGNEKSSLPEAPGQSMTATAEIEQEVPELGSSLLGSKAGLQEMHRTPAWMPPST